MIFGRTLMRRTNLWAGALLLLAAALWAAPAMPQAAPATPRIVAIGDIHGELDGLVGILQKAGVIDAARKWAGGNTTLVVTGDYVDRGANTRGVMDLLMELEKQAPKSGGRAVILLGNHEVMNIYGDLRYVTPEIFASFATKDSEKRRQSAWRAYQNFLRARAKVAGQPAPMFTPEMQAEWMAAHPPGFFEHRDAFGPRGKYGKWLRGLEPVAQIDGVIFIHGGISTAIRLWKLEDIKARVHNELTAFDGFTDYLVKQKLTLPFFTDKEILDAAKIDFDARQIVLAADGEGSKEPSAADRHHMDVLKELLDIGSWLTVNPEGPFWFRGLAVWEEKEKAAEVDAILAAQGAKHFVIGHSTTRGTIVPRFGGKVFLIDTGMLASHYQGGRAAALEIVNGKFTAIYPDERVVVFDPAAAPRSGLFRGAEDEAAGEELGGGAQGPGPNAAKQPAAQPKPARVWMGPDGQPLPFASEEEMMEFMRTAKVVSMKTVGKGITLPRRVLLEKDGVRMHAFFRDINEEKDRFTGAAGTTELFFRDSYIFEMAAFELSRLLGLDFVPPTILRRISGDQGSLQVWVENAVDEGDRVKKKINPPGVETWRKDLAMMRVWDALIYNMDRNVGNILYGPDWKFWSIDHTRTFRRHDTLKDPHLVTRCDRVFWETLRTVDDATITARLKPYLQRYEIEGLLKRRRVLVALIQKLITERGEDQVLFSLR